MASRPLVLLAALLLAPSCSGNGDDDDGATLGDTVAPTEVTAPDVPAVSPAGTGVVVIGGTSSSFAVTRCQLEPSPAEGGTATLLVITGEGTTGSGIPFQVELLRTATDTSVAETFTDTVSYTDTARILQIQRFEVAGEVSDLRDPDARGTLLRVRPDGVSAAGLAGPPGTGAQFDEGIVGLALDATC